MTDLTLTIASANDQRHWRDTQPYNGTLDLQSVNYGWTSAGTNNFRGNLNEGNIMFFRPSSNALKDGVFSSAVLRFVAAFDNDEDVMDISIEGVLGNPGLPQNYADVASMQRTGAVIWAGVEHWVAGQTYDSPDISEIIQEICSQESYNEDDPIILIINNNLTSTIAPGEFQTYRTAHGYVSSAANAPDLVMTYVSSTNPIITAVNPGTGSVNGGDTITILGSGFTGADSVTFGTPSNPAPSTRYLSFEIDQIYPYNPPWQRHYGTGLDPATRFIVTTDEARSGSRSCFIRLLSTDPVSPQTSIRTEWMSGDQIFLGAGSNWKHERWVGFSHKFMPNWKTGVGGTTTGEHILWQTHSLGDKIAGGTSPIVALSVMLRTVNGVNAHRYVFRSENANMGVELHVLWDDPNPLSTYYDKWVDWKVRIIHARDAGAQGLPGVTAGTGTMQVWRRIEGEGGYTLVYSAFNTRTTNGNNTQYVPYDKCGIYLRTAQYYLDEFKVHDGTDGTRVEPTGSGAVLGTNINVVSDTELEIDTPANAEGTVQVFVIKNGVSSNAGTFTFSNQGPTPPSNLYLSPFAADSQWKSPVGTGRTLSAAGAQVTLDSRTGSLNVNANNGFSHPVYLASNTDPLVDIYDVREGLPGAPILAETNVRAPVNAVGATGTDNHIAIVTPDQLNIDEGFKVDLAGGHPGAGGGDWVWEIHKRNPLNGPGWTLTNGQNNGTQATGAMNIGGLIRQWECDAATISHALSGAFRPDQLRGGTNTGMSITGFSGTETIVWPASTRDGSASTNTGTVPYGGCFVLDHTVYTDAVIDAALSDPLERAVAKAVRDYGFFVTDRGSSASVFAEPGITEDQRAKISTAINWAQDRWQMITNLTPTNDFPKGGGDSIVGEPEQGSPATYFATLTGDMPASSGVAARSGATFGRVLEGVVGSLSGDASQPITLSDCSQS